MSSSTGLSTVACLRDIIEKFVNARPALPGMFSAEQPSPRLRLAKDSGRYRTRKSCRTQSCARQLILFSLDSMGWAVAFRLGGASIVSTVESHLPLLKELWLAVDEIVRHDDVMPAIIVRPSKAASPIEEIRTQARLEAVVCAMCWAVPVDERICYLFRCVCEFGTVVPFKLVVLKSRAEQPFHFRLVAPLERARHAGRWWDILIGNLEHTPNSAFSRPRLDCNTTVFAGHACDLVRCLLLIGRKHETA